MRLIFITLLCAAAITAGGSAPIRFVQASTAPEPRTRLETPVTQTMAGLRHPFIENRGQADPRIRFYTSTPRGSVAITEDGALTYAFATAPTSDGMAPGATLSEALVGATVRTVRGENRSATRVNVFHGNDRARWKHDLATYDSVSLGEVYPGIDVRLRAAGGSVEKVFTVRPGADPNRVRLRVVGGRELAVTAAGELEVRTGDGPVHFSRPIAYQEHGDVRTPVDVAYLVEHDRYGFRLGAFDPTHALIIDPHLISTYLGGSGDDGALDILTDGAGSVYVAGYTTSIDFPGIGSGSPDSALLGCSSFTEAFVAKLDDGLTSIQAVTYLGGSGLFPEFASSLAMNAVGEIYVAGFTGSADFPGVSTLAVDTTAIAFEAFVVRLNHDLTAILSGTFLGGGSHDGARALAYDGVTDRIYVAGSTRSSDFPGIVSGAPDSQFQGGAEAFVVALLPSLQQPVLGATYLGGSNTGGAEIAHDIAFDEAGNVFVTGTTDSPDFPQVSGADTLFTGPTEAFVVKLAPSLTGILGATFLGTAYEDEGTAIARLDHATGFWIYVAGSTQNGFAFPGLSSNSADSAYGGLGHRGFIAQLDPGLNVVVSSLLGGSGRAMDVATIPDFGDSVYVTGTTSSTLSSVGGSAADLTKVGQEGFVLRLDPGLTTFLRGTYLGGAGGDQSLSIAIDSSNGGVYAAGVTWSSVFPGVGVSAPDHTGVGSEAFVARLDADLKSHWAVILEAVKELVFSLSRFDLRPLTEQIDRVEDLALRGNFRAAIAQMEQFIRWADRLSPRLPPPDNGRRLIAMAEALIAELEHMDRRRREVVEPPARQPGGLLPACPAPGPADPLSGLRPPRAR